MIDLNLTSVSFSRRKQKNRFLETTDDNSRLSLKYCYSANELAQSTRIANEEMRRKRGKRDP